MALSPLVAKRCSAWGFVVVATGVEFVLNAAGGGFLGEADIGSPVVVALADVLRIV